LTTQANGIAATEEKQMAESTENQNPFKTCFESSEPKGAQIAMAVAELLECLDKPENPRLMKSWAKHLAIYPGEQLAAAFSVLALTSKGWPTLGDITEAITEQEYAAEWQWIMQVLNRHARIDGETGQMGLRDRDPVYGPDKRLSYDSWEKGPMLKPAEPAPEIPARIKAALEIVGGGSLTQGMREMNKHPATGNCQYEAAADVMKIKFSLERDFKAAWYTVRRREMGAGR
jgi:hypothetical protein